MSDALSSIITQENGKTIAEAKAEVSRERRSGLRHSNDDEGYNLKTWLAASVRDDDPPAARVVAADPSFRFPDDSVLVPPVRDCDGKASF